MKPMPPGLAEAIAGTASEGPPSDKLQELTELGRQLEAKKREIAEKEADLKSVKAAANTLVHKTLPDLMAELRLDTIGIPDLNVDVNARAFYKANISAEWDTERQEAAFAWLEANGFGSLIKHDVTFSFRRGEEARAQWLVELVVAAALKRGERLAQEAADAGRPVGPADTWDMPTPTVRKNVPHSTLTALVRSQTELPADSPDKKVLPLELLGAMVGRIVEIKPRDNK